MVVAVAPVTSSGMEELPFTLFVGPSRQTGTVLVYIKASQERVVAEANLTVITWMSSYLRQHFTHNVKLNLEIG